MSVPVGEVVCPAWNDAWVTYLPALAQLTDEIERGQSDAPRAPATTTPPMRSAQEEHSMYGKANHT